MTVTIPSMPELEMQGVKQALTIRVLECSKGGFMVLYDGYGIAAKSSWDEVLESIEAAGKDAMGLEKMAMPRLMAKAAAEKANSVLNTLGLFVIGLGSALASFISVKIA